MSLPARVDVLVIGAGPKGLMFAVQLARLSVRVLIVDRNPGPSVATKALGVQARTVEIYSRLGIAARALEAGMRASGANIWVEGTGRTRTAREHRARPQPVSVCPHPRAGRQRAPARASVAR